MNNYYLIDGQWYSEDELYHHGVLGMKWGVRRYQNADGTLTEAGKKRYSKDAPYQGNMTAREREEYAKTRIQERGARQAIDDENDNVNKHLLDNVKIGGMSALLGATVASIATGNPLVGAGAAYVGFLGGTALSNFALIPGQMKRSKNASRNIDTIKRISDIPDLTTGERKNTRT